MAPVYTETMKRLIIYSEKMVRDCAMDLADILEKVDENSGPYVSIYKKYK
jgi:hypothetical protein